jgi:hypothetical protein
MGTAISATRTRLNVVERARRNSVELLAWAALLVIVIP